MGKNRKKVLTGCAASFAMAVTLAFGSISMVPAFAAEKTTYINLDTSNSLKIVSSSETNSENVFPPFMAEKIRIIDGTIEKVSEDENTEETVAAEEETETVSETESETETAAESQAATAEEEQPETAASVPDVRSQVIAFALQFVGCPYVYGGTSLSGGCDCSGFTMGVFSNFGISLPHSSASQSGCGSAVSLDCIQPGDLVFYGDGGGIYHVAIYIGGGQIVHAIDESRGIGVSSLYCLTPVYAVSVLD